MTPQQYRRHKSTALRAAFLSGELVGWSGSDASNPYRRRGPQRNPTRGSWSESYARAWSVGRDEGARQRAELIAGGKRAPAGALDSEGAEVDGRDDAAPA